MPPSPPPGAASTRRLRKRPIELGAAAFVFRETTDEMVELQEDIEGWHLAHEHTPKAKEVQSFIILTRMVRKSAHNIKRLWPRG